ncbi:TIGR02117 family protein [Pontibacter qinzhouensis]|uniref:TIGR02117 family protein n=1 Tax=Pontibacter qinzhouensis TaxID=2603253 RepID=A0A5C8K981_9BACT|nr:TIGR02117 family protein [Pontibacter qinzhouensis]TXK50733.1 TIGR02117 family protein [Pontibacter qinzhouensis]
MTLFFKKLLMFLAKVAAGVLLLVTLFFVLGFLLSSFPVNRSFAQTPESTIRIFVTSNGVHTDLVLPVVTPLRDWRQKLPLQDFATTDSTFTHIGFGWGDRRFYMETPEWSDLKLNVALTSALWPTRTAMHVEYIRSSLATNDRQRPVLLTLAQYQQLIEFIDSSFQQQNGEYVLIEGSGYSGHDNFYEAHGKFYATKNCNSWVNKGLKAADVKTAWWAPFPYAIMRHLR